MTTLNVARASALTGVPGASFRTRAPVPPDTRNLQSGRPCGA